MTNNSLNKKIKIIHLNTNMGIIGVRTNFRKAIFGTLSFFLSRTKESIFDNSNIENTVLPIIKGGGDILSFSEVFGIKQVKKVIELLDTAGYKTYHTDAFEMWSQDEKQEHLYNIIGVKNSSFDYKITISKITKLRNKRKLEGLIISLIYIFRGIKKYKLSVFKKSFTLYNRLAKGILDGAIISINIGNIFKFSHLHIHSDNKQLDKYFLEHIDDNMPHVMIGDFNIGNIDNFLEKSVFSGRTYQCLNFKKIKTFSFAKGLYSFGKLIQNNPDNIIGNSFIKNINTYTIDSNSDHQGLVSIIKLNNFDFL